MENKSSIEAEPQGECFAEKKEIHQEETFESPDGKWTLYMEATSDGTDIKLDPDWVENDDFIETSDDSYFGEYHE